MATPQDPYSLQRFVHPLLGPRLRECTALVNAVEGKPIEKIFAHPDDLKFRSSMTLFARAIANDTSRRNWLFGGGVFEEALRSTSGPNRTPQRSRWSGSERHNGPAPVCA